MTCKTAEELDGAFGCYVVAPETQVNNRLVVGMENVSELLDACTCETVFAEVQLCKLIVIFDNLADNMHRLIAKSHFRKIQFASASHFMVLHHHIKKAKHLLLGCIDNQVLAFSDVELKKKLLFNAFNLGNMLYLVTELAYVNFSNLNSLNYRISTGGVLLRSSAPHFFVRAESSKTSHTLCLVVNHKTSIFLSCRCVLLDWRRETVFNEWVRSNLHGHKVLA